MKVIDLLNKIANGEIDINSEYQFSRYDYCTINEFFAIYLVDEENLNLEIIEEKKIPEKLISTSLKGIDNLDEKIEIAHIDTISAIDKINEIIDYLKSKGE